MKHTFSRLACALVLIASTAHAENFSNKTFLRQRSIVSDNSLLHFHSQPTEELGFTFSSTFFFRNSHNPTSVAQYFGGGQAVNNNQNGTFTAVTAVTDSDKARVDTLDALDIDPGEAFTSNISLDPALSEYGMHLQLKKQFKKSGVFISIDLPIVKKEGSLQPTITDTDDDHEAKRYFHGGLLQLYTDKVVQDTLKYARISEGKTSFAGIADLTTSVGYTALDTDDEQCTAALCITFPTGTKSSGKELFEAQLGQGHLGVGAQLTYQRFLAKIEAAELSFFSKVEARYFFEAREKRTLGLFNHLYDRLANAGAYRSLGAHSTANPLPAANVLTRDLLVTPGGQIDLNLGLNYVHSRVCAHVGYNLYLRAKETLELPSSQAWVDGEYAQLQKPYQTSTNLPTSLTNIIIGHNDWTEAGPIQAEGNRKATTASNGAALGSRNTLQYYVSRDACTSPSDISQKVGGSLTYELTPSLYCSCGGEYEWDVNALNSGVRSWAIWGQLNISF